MRASGHSQSLLPDHAGLRSRWFDLAKLLFVIASYVLAYTVTFRFVGQTFGEKDVIYIPLPFLAAMIVSIAVPVISGWTRRSFRYWIAMRLVVALDIFTWVGLTALWLNALYQFI